MAELKDQFAELIKNGGVEVKNLVVKNCFVTPKIDYSLVTCKVNQDIKGVEYDDDEYKLVDNSRTMFCYDHDIMRVVSEMPELALFKRVIAKEPAFLETVLMFAKINIVQVVIPANEEYISPFSGRTHDVRDHDSVRTYVESITLGNEGETFIAGLKKEYQKMMIKKLLKNDTPRSIFDDDDED